MRCFLPLLACVFLIACGDDDGATDDPAVDGGPIVDAGDGTDGGSSAEDAGPAADGGPETDAGAPADGGPGADLGLDPCAGTLLGSECTDSCSRGYECVDGVCMPDTATRPSCGGFAAEMCTTRAFPHCVYYEDADYGPCLSEAELACACSTALASRFVCPDR